MLNIFGIHFVDTKYLFLFPILLVVLFLQFKNFQRIRRGLKKIVHKKNEKLILKNFSAIKFFIKNILFVSALALFVLAFLRPQWGKKDKVVEQVGRDVLVVLDISRSMLAKDLRPSRIEFAKLKIRNLLSKFEFERVGLILFAGDAFVQCPMTSDYSAFLLFLDQVDAHTISGGSTDLGKAFLKMEKVFGGNIDRKNKLVVLLTDGEDYSLNLSVAKDWARKQEIKIFGLGIGLPGGAPIPILDAKGNQNGHEVDKNGKPILSVLNEKLLSSICKDLGGVYVRAKYEDVDLDQIVGRIKQFEKEKFGDRQISHFEDRYPWFLGIAWLLLLIEWVL